MSLIASRRWLLPALLACFVLLWGCPGVAQDDAPGDPEDPQAAEQPEEPADPYAVPETEDAQELIDFVEGLKQMRPRSAKEYFEMNRKRPEAIKAAAKKIVELVPDEGAEAHKKAAVYLLELRAMSIARESEENQKEILTQVKQHFASKTMDRNDVGLAMNVARALEMTGQTDLAVDAYNSFAAEMKKADDPNMARMVEMLQGSARRIGLVGNPMELSGKTFEGDDFNLTSLKGKVVLVDFWATWCGPCRAEHPNIKKAYQQYNGKGFEVVGVSLDDDREKLGKYLEEEEVPWTTLHDETENGHPAARYYGVMGIPTMMLIGEDGNVVSLRARGGELTRLLGELLGEPLPIEEPAEGEGAEDEPAEKT